MKIETRTIPANEAPRRALPGQIILVLQGGGALGAYQTGVYRALHEAGMEPDWVIGTSIGAINAALIAGNPPEERQDRMAEFWERITHSGLRKAMSSAPFVGMSISNWMTMMGGVGAFFQPNPRAFWGLHTPLGRDGAGYYSTMPLRRTLEDLVDFDRLNSGATRLTVGAANVATGEMRYFDSRDEPLDVRHIMSSGALPPAFPAVRIGDDYYWDGGILSNTPVEAVFDDNPRRNALVFAVHVWNPSGRHPETIWEIMNRQKDIQYASRAVSHIQRQRQLHKLRHIIKELASRLPDDERSTPLVQEMESYGCLTRMHVVRLLAPTLRGEDHQKDIDFSPSGIAERCQAGYEHTQATIAAAPWEGAVDELEGFVLHESIAST
jgi:NTE family protein